jgi:DNA polymerase-1
MSVIQTQMKERGTPLRVEGKWACGPCPKCGGDDRFRVVFDPERGREFFSCRMCGTKGDDIQYLRDYLGMSFQEAKDVAERGRGSGSTPPVSAIVNYDMWFDACAGMVVACGGALLADGAALESLERQRGIRAETAQKFRLGLNQRDHWMPRRDFGLCPKLREDGTECDLCVPAGFVIPIVMDDLLHGAQVRRFEPYANNRYMLVPGSELLPMVFPGGSDMTIIIVESYLDAMLLWQEAGAACTVVALGSASIAPSGAVKALIENAETVLVALDSDEAGAAQAWNRWMTQFPNASRCPIPHAYGKDPTEGWRKGLDLAAWVEAGLHLAHKHRACGGTTANETREPGTVYVGEATATFRCIAEAGDAREAVAAIVAACSAVGVAFEVVPCAQYAKHPHAGRHPKLSRLRRVAVYAHELDEVVVFEMGDIKRADLAPLWGLFVVCHDGVEAMLCIAALRKMSGRVESTLLMANAVLNQRLDFDAALKRYTKLPPIVEGVDTPGGLAARALALSILYPELHARLGEHEARPLYRLMREAQGVIGKLEVDGIAFDREAHGELCNAWAGEQADWRAILPADLDPGSHKAVRAWLLRVVPKERRQGWKRTSTDELSTCDDNLGLVADIPEIHALREYRRLGKLLSTYGERFAAHLNPVTGRLHGHWSIGGMVTGRTGVNTPNLQGLPRDPAFRALFRAPEGRSLLAGDVSQFQLRILAHIADDKEMLAAYADGIDLHTATAAILAGVAVEELTKEHRRLAKAANFGVAFGQGALGFRDYAARGYQVDLSEREADRIRKAWLRRFEGVARWHEQTAAYLRDGYAIETAAGRMARKADLAGNALQQALAFQIQGTEAEIMLRALAAMYPVLREHGALLGLFSHDEIIVEVEDDAETVAAMTAAVEGAIADAFRHYFPDATVEGLVEVRAVSHWGEAK